MDLCWNCCDTCEKILPKHKTADCDCNCDLPPTLYVQEKYTTNSNIDEIKRLEKIRKLRESQTNCKWGSRCKYISSCPYKHPIISIKPKNNRLNYFQNRMKNYKK